MRRYGYRPELDPDQVESVDVPVSVLPRSYLLAGVKPGDKAEVSDNNGVVLGTVEVLDPNPAWSGVNLKVLTSIGWYPIGYSSVWSQLTYRVLP